MHHMHAILHAPKIRTSHLFLSPQPSHFVSTDLGTNVQQPFLKILISQVNLVHLALSKLTEWYIILLINSIPVLC